MKTSVSETIVRDTEVNTPTLVGSKSDRTDADRIGRLRAGESSYREVWIELSGGQRAAPAEELETNVRAELDEEDERLAAAGITTSGPSSTG